MGRPRLPENQRRNWTHSVNFYEGEYRSIARHAISKHTTIAEFLRKAAIEKMEREKEAAP